MLNLFKKQALGLDISDYSIELISLEGSFEKPRLLAMGRKMIDQGIVKEGKILNKEKLKKSLEELISQPKFGKIKTRKLIFSLPESKSFIQIFKIPSDLGEKKEKEEIESQISQIIPYQLAELYFDYIIREAADFKEVLLIAAPKEIVDDYLTLFESCKLEALELEVESESLARSLILPSEEEKTTLIIDIGARTTNFIIFDETGLRLSISSPLAGNWLTQILMDKLKISKEKAEDLKKTIGLNPKKEQGRIFLILQKEISKIIEEANKIIEYFQKKEGKEIQKIILAGGTATLPYLLEYFSQNLEKEVIIGDPWTKINIDILGGKKYFKKALEVNPLFYSTVIGSALRGLAKNLEEAGSNLLPKGR